MAIRYIRIPLKEATYKKFLAVVNAWFKAHPDIKGDVNLFSLNKWHDLIYEEVLKK